MFLNSASNFGLIHFIIFQIFQNKIFEIFHQSKLMSDPSFSHTKSSLTLKVDENTSSIPSTLSCLIVEPVVLLNESLLNFGPNFKKIKPPIKEVNTSYHKRRTSDGLVIGNLSIGRGDHNLEILDENKLDERIEESQRITKQFKYGCSCCTTKSNCRNLKCKCKKNLFLCKLDCKCKGMCQNGVSFLETQNMKEEDLKKCSKSPLKKHSLKKY
jgi:hypothetical protein